MKFQNEDEAVEAISTRARKLADLRSPEYVAELLDVAIEDAESEGGGTENRRDEPKSNTGELFDGRLEPGSAAARRFEAAGGTIQDRD